MSRLVAIRANIDGVDFGTLKGDYILLTGEVDAYPACAPVMHRRPRMLASETDGRTHGLLYQGVVSVILYVACIYALQRLVRSVDPFVGRFGYLTVAQQCRPTRTV